MKRPLLFLTVGATVGVSVLCGIAAQAYAAPERAVSAKLVQVPPLSIPVGYQPPGFAPSTRSRNGLVVVNADPAETVASGTPVEPGFNQHGNSSDTPSVSAVPVPSHSSSVSVSEPGKSAGKGSSDAAHSPQGNGNGNAVGKPENGNNGNNGNAGENQNSPGNGKGNNGNGKAKGNKP